MADLFISYAREDQDFVRRLHRALSRRGKEGWVDWEGIPPTAAWMAEIRSAIGGADAFVFVLSPDSAESKVCGDELGIALEQNKRIVPLLRRPPDGQEVPGALAELNWIFFRDEDGFDEPIHALVEALETDLDRVRLHTRLLVRARDWQERDRDPSRLLRGADLREAEAFISQAEARPEPTALQREYLAASRQLATRRQRLLLGGVSLALVISLALAALAYIERGTAIANQKTAKSRELAALATLQLPLDPQISLALALAANHVGDTSQAGAALLRAAFDDQLIATLQGHDGPVYAANYSPEGRRVVGAGGDGTGRVWDLDRRARAQVLTGHRGRVTAAAFSPDGRRVLSAGQDGTVRVWDLEHPGASRVLTGHRGGVEGAAYSPDGGRVVSAGDDGTVRVWNLEHPAANRVLTGARGRVLAAAFSPDGHRVVGAGDDAVVRVWDLARPGSAPRLLAGHQGSVQGAAFSPDGRRVVSAGYDGTVRIWDLEHGDSTRVLAGHQGSAYSAAFSPDGKRVASAGGDGAIRIWDLDQGARTRVLAGHQGRVYAAAFSPDGHRVVSGATDATVRVWDLDRSSLLRVLTGHRGSVYAAAFAPDGHRLVSAGADGTVRVWDLAHPAADRVLTGHRGSSNAAAFSPDGHRIVSAGFDGTVRIWDLDHPAANRVLTGHRGGVEAAAFSPDGRRVVSGGHDRTVRVVTCTVCRPLAQVLAEAQHRLDQGLLTPGEREFVAERVKAEG